MKLSIWVFLLIGIGFSVVQSVENNVLSESCLENFSDEDITDDEMSDEEEGFSCVMSKVEKEKRQKEKMALLVLKQEQARGKELAQEEERKRQAMQEEERLIKRILPPSVFYPLPESAPLKTDEAPCLPIFSLQECKEKIQKIVSVVETGLIHAALYLAYGNEQADVPCPYKDILYTSNPASASDVISQVTSYENLNDHIKRD